MASTLLLVYFKFPDPNVTMVVPFVSPPDFAQPVTLALHKLMLINEYHRLFLTLANYENQQIISHRLF